MIDNRLRVPPSPPYSPRMSDSVRTAEHYSQQATLVHARPEYRQCRESAIAGAGYSDDVSAYSHDPTEASLRPYKTFNYSPGSSGGPCSQYNIDPYTQVQLGSRQKSKSSQALRHMGSTDVRSAAHGISTSASPVDRLTPHSPDNSVHDQQDDDDLIDSAGEDQDEGSEKIQMTAAELRAHKRKMKRFRLTHSQTRFLMSEFARQAHPDAGHRERLAREIPGLSARQVQVWFQNRRAKLKRHTTDDQARMMRSRALPDDFDTTQALHSPFGAQPPIMSASTSSLGSFSTYGDHASIRPLALDTTRALVEYDQYNSSYASPTGVSPALGAFAFTPPHSSSGHISPGSSHSMPPYAMQHQAAYESSRRGAIGLPALETGYGPMNNLQRAPPHEQITRTSSETTSSPLPTSVSHPNIQSHMFPDRSSSFSGHMAYDHQRSHPPRSLGMTDSDPYRSSYTYAAPQTYSSNESQHRPTSGQHATNMDHFRRAPVGITYGHYAPQNYTSAPYQNYATPYAPRDVHNTYAQESHRETLAHTQQAHTQLDGMHGADRAFALPVTTQVTETSGSTSIMPPSY
ncbi:uncharacterized protein RCC_01909 [Ramularia collo-cygni]|uniref:Homeobox domain-containing protein n=1 Tax=Ramularia collo-cygni TaxID=112498 RepID=A0A2D3V3I8_9PEZI|nr:uncharacterized protein RCC_01909 [Ramularia collo-cygni]CZT16069.1 uncharacterized protein RCC_01909 [Ramularia collo-cygni]